MSQSERMNNLRTAFLKIIYIYKSRILEKHQYFCTLTLQNC